PDADLGRRALAVVQGHPKLLELADAAAADPARLRDRLAAAAAPVDPAGGQLAAFFAARTRELGGAGFLRVLGAWAGAAGAGPAPRRRAPWGGWWPGGGTPAAPPGWSGRCGRPWGGNGPGARRPRRRWARRWRCCGRRRCSTSSPAAPAASRRGWWC